MTAGAGHDETGLLQQHGRGARRIDQQEIVAALPGPLLDSVGSRPISASTRRMKREFAQKGKW